MEWKKGCLLCCIVAVVDVATVVFNLLQLAMCVCRDIFWLGGGTECGIAQCGFTHRSSCIVAYVYTQLLK